MPGLWGWGLTIADWNNADWWVASREEAMALAEEIVARPSFTRGTGVVEIPFDD